MTLFNEPHELHGELLPLYQDLCAVGRRMKLLHLDESETELALQHLDHLPPPNLVSVIVPNRMAYLFGTDDRQTIFQNSLCSYLYGFLFLF